MKTPLYHTKMVLTQKPTQPRQLEDTRGESTTAAIRPGESDKITISAAALKKSQETESPEDRLPPHIKRIKAQIKEIKRQIEEQQQKIAQLSQSNLSDEVKDATMELYLEQLMGLQSSLALNLIALKQAIKDQGITDPVLLMAAIFN